VLLISCLFILLAARLPLEELTEFDPRNLLFVAVLILVVRPVTVFLASLGTSLTWRERAFVAWMAPRGIVAAAMASVFALELAAHDVPGADRLASVVFTVIVVTVAVYGLTAGLVARWLGLSRGAPQGVLILGAHAWAREIGRALQKEGIDVVLADTNHHDAQTARIEGLEAWYGNVLSEDFDAHAPLDGLGYLVCLTRNDEVNSLACLHLTPLFGRAATHQLAPALVADRRDGNIPLHLRGKVLFGEGIDFWTLRARFRDGAVVKRTRLGDEWNYEDFLAIHDRPDAPVIPLFAIREDGRLRIFTAGEAPRVEEGEILLAVVDPVDENGSG
jgi:hypothetical protein